MATIIHRYLTIRRDSVHFKNVSDIDIAFNYKVIIDLDTCTQSTNNGESTRPRGTGRRPRTLYASSLSLCQLLPIATDRRRASVGEARQRRGRHRRPDPQPRGNVRSAGFRDQPWRFRDAGGRRTHEPGGGRADPSPDGGGHRTPARLRPERLASPACGLDHAAGQTDRL